MLKTNRLSIREFQAGDLTACVEALSNPSMQKFIEAEGFKSAEDLARVYLSSSSDIKNWSVWSQERLVGVVDVYRTPSIFQSQEMRDPTFCFGIWTAAKYQGNGYAKEAANCVLLQTFENNPELNFIQASCFDTNLSSKGLMRSLGFYPLQPTIYNSQVDLPYIRHRAHPHFDYEKYLSPSRSSPVAARVGPDKLDY